MLLGNGGKLKEFYEKAINSGGVCDGEPGLRDVHLNFYAAYILDPTGNKLVVVCHLDWDN